VGDQSAGLVLGNDAAVDDSAHPPGAQIGDQRIEEEALHVGRGRCHGNAFLDVLWCRHAIMSDGSKEMRVMLFRREPADRITKGCATS
jgi:hypothetical protein